TDIRRHAYVIVGAGLHAPFVDPNAVGFLQHAVDEAATATASENHCIRTFEEFDPFSVVEVAKNLAVIAHAIDEKIRSRVLAANGDLVVVFPAWMQIGARNIPKNALDPLPPDSLRLFFGTPGARLRNIAQGRIGLGGS